MAGVTAYLGLGSNLGDRRAHLDAGVRRLDQVPGIAVARVSRWLETEPVGGPPQGPYLNGAVQVTTTLPPHALLAVCKEIERERGRDLAAPRNHPRPLDVDLLLYGDRRIDTVDLQVPHPRVWDRDFVRLPLLTLGVDLAQWPRQPRPERWTDVAAAAAGCEQWLRGGCRIGLVPTMGALHDGHAALLAAARAECDRVVASIFVNPLQFEAAADLSSYPRSQEADLELLRRCETDAVFAPTVEAMYGDGFASRIAVGGEAEGMEGSVRPGHFSGVATVVAKLLAVLRPTLAYFGDKDGQQVAVVERLQRDLGFPVRIRRCPTVREPDGLALSSRNVFLSPADRAAAPVLHRALSAVQQAWIAGERDVAALAEIGRRIVAGEPRATLDYFEIRAGRAFVAARFRDRRETRLIDNIELPA